MVHAGCAAGSELQRETTGRRLGRRRLLVIPGALYPHAASFSLEPGHTAQVLRVRQVCVQCWTEGAHSLHGQSPRRKQRVLHSTLISASRFLLEKSQMRSLEIHPTRLGARARAQRRASVIYSHTQRICLSHRYGASRSTSHLSKQHQWTTRAHCSDTVGRVTHARTLALARRSFCSAIAHLRCADRSDDKSCGDSCHGLKRGAPGIHLREHTAIPACVRDALCVSGEGGSRGEKGEGGTASSVKVWLKRNATDGG